jgi:dienelactone hydrolase
MRLSLTVKGATLALWVCGRAAAAEPERVTFETFDHITIHGDYYAPPPSAGKAPLAILLHMCHSDRSAWTPVARPLQAAGFGVLAIDLRGHGASATDALRARVEARDPTLFRAMFQDVRGAYDWIAQRDEIDRARFALVGASVGASVALQYAAEDLSVDVVVCLTPGLDYLGMNSQDDIRRIEGRRIHLVATRDEREAAERLAKLNAGAAATILPGAAHGTRMFGSVPGITKKIVDFLKEGVGRSTDTTVFASINSEVYHLPGSGWIEKIKPSNLRCLSSPEEAGQRGLRAARSRRPSDWREEKP